MRKYVARPATAYFSGSNESVTAYVAIGISTAMAPSAGNTMRSGIRKSRRSTTDTATSVENTTKYTSTTHQRENLSASSAHRAPLTNVTATRPDIGSGSGSGIVS